MSTITSKTFFGHECNTLCQCKSIAGQLGLGVRYFDIRPVFSEGKYYTGHHTKIESAGIITWQGTSGQSIKSIVEEVNAFNEYYRELIILNVFHSLSMVEKNADWRSFNLDEWEGLLTELQQLKNLFEVPSNPGIDLTMLTLNDFIREHGAVVVVMENFNDLAGYYGNGFYLASNLDVYNSYANTYIPDDMINDQLDKMSENSPENYFLLSWTLTQSDSQAATCFSGMAPSILTMASFVNQRLPAILFDHVSSVRFPNIIYMDNIVSTDPVALAMAINWKVKRTIFSCG